MASQVSICNQALGRLGANLIISVDDNTVEGRLCKAYYEDVLSAVLEEHTWSFAMGRYALTPSAEPAPEPFANKFLIPVQCLMVIQTSPNPDFRKQQHFNWVLEGEYILCNAGKVYIHTIDRVTDPKKYTSTFIRAFAVRMAAEMSLAITQSREMHRGLMEEYAILLDRAANLDALQGVNRRINSDQLILVRHQGTGTAGPYV